MDDLTSLLHAAASHAASFRATLGTRPVTPPADLDRLRAAFGGPLPSRPAPPEQVLQELIEAAEPGLMASVGPRFFGFVIGGALPAATAADVLAAGWDQCAFNATLSPAAVIAEEVAGGWIKELLGIPAEASVGFVTGGQEANTVGLAAARHRVLADAGWDVDGRGLAGAPSVRVLASEERHATVDRSLRLLGLGTAALRPVRSGRNGAVDLDDLGRVLAEDAAANPPGAGVAAPIVCLQAGNVNTGAMDDLRGAITLAQRHRAWVHVDGAFGLWAGADPRRAAMVDGLELADSWATDGHKWLNVPYDCGLAICRDPQLHSAAVSYTAAYLTGQGGPVIGGADLTLESSRRARGFAVWSALRELGAEGVADMVDRCCSLAERFADGLAAGGAKIGNEVVLNQVLAAFGDDDQTDRVVAAVQRDGTCWLGGTSWRGRRYLRVSISNHATTEADVDLSVQAILRLAGMVG